MQDIDVFNGRNVSEADLERIRASYNANGLVCVRLLDEAQCEDLVLEQWQHIILKQEWTDEYKIVVHGTDGRVLDISRQAKLCTFHVGEMFVLD